VATVVEQAMAALVVLMPKQLQLCHPVLTRSSLEPQRQQTVDIHPSRPQA
jgi:hypothetical protein